MTTAEETKKAGVLVEPSPYYTSPSYFSHGGKVATIVQLEVLTYTNRHLDFASVIGMIPVDPLKGVDLYHIVSDSIIRDDDKKRLIRENATGGSQVIEAKESDGDIEDAQTVTAQNKNEADREDYDDYESIIDRSDPVVCYNIELMIVADTQKLVEEQLETINAALSRKYDGATWDSTAGSQSERLEKIFDIHEPSMKTKTSTGFNYANHNYAVSAGLVDKRGFEIGLDVLAIKPTESSFDFDGSLKHLAFIANPKTARAVEYTDHEKNQHVPLSSVIAQQAANHTFIDPDGRKRVHHLVLNDFDYFDDDMFFRTPKVAQVFKRYDMSRITINPLQGFGRWDELLKVKELLNNKIVSIFNVLMDLRMNDQALSIVLEAVENFYFKEQLWFADAAERPKRTRILNIARPELYPTMIQLMSTFTTMEAKEKKEKNFQRMNDIKALKTKLESALSSYMPILGNPTSLTPTNAPQVYYDFSSISTRKMKQIQYLNVLMYVVSTAQRGDVIVVHGADQLYLSVAQQTFDTVEMAQKRGVRFIFSFDTISSAPDTVDELADIFNLKGTYYKDLSDDVDYSFIGQCLPEEVEMVQKALNTPLSETISVNLASKNAKNQVMVHRRSDSTNNFVYLKTVI